VSNRQVCWLKKWCRFPTGQVCHCRLKTGTTSLKEYPMTDENLPAKEDDVGTAVAEPTAESTDEKKDKIEQTVDISDIGPCRKHIRVTVARKDIDKRFDEKYSELVGDSQVPGFRPGKAPRSIVVRKFKKEVQEQVRAQILLASLEQLADDFDVAPLSPPDIN